MDSRSSQGTVILAFFLAVLIGSGNFVAVSFSNQELDPFWGAGLRFALAGLLFVIISLKILKGVVKRRRDWRYGAVGLASMVLVATHSLMDFSLQIPAVSIAFMAIVGVALAQSDRPGRVGSLSR